MAQVVVRNIDDAAFEGMRQRAKRNARSLEAELRCLIEEEGRREAEREAFWERAAAIRALGSAFDQTDSAELRRIGRKYEDE